MITGDIEARVRFFTTEEGGRKGPTPEKWFGCLFHISDAYFDCRLMLAEHGSISPGDELVVPISFLNFELVKKHLHRDAIFSLWDGRTIAKGKVMKIYPTTG